MNQLTDRKSRIYEQTRYKLVLYLCVFFIIMLSLTSLINLVHPNYNPIPDFFALGVAIASYVILKKTRNYRYVAMFATISIFLIITSAFFFMKALHYTTPGWMMVNIMFTYFVLGHRWGLVMLLLHFIVFFTYLFLFHAQNVQNALPYKMGDIAVFALEYLIIAAAIGYLLYLFMITSNYSEKKLMTNNRLLDDQNKLIRKQNAEMEVMLKEIHHRVKNNLQIISSLLRLQSEKDVKEEQEMFREAIDRVNAIAMIHERIYKTDTLSEFDMKVYLETLVRHLLDSYTLQRPVDVKLDVEVEEICTECLVPISLLFNELISNSLKHAFKQQEKPKITILLKNETEELLIISYSDNGQWVESDKQSFGAELIEAMTHQMDGTFTRESDAESTRYEFRLRKKNYR